MTEAHTNQKPSEDTPVVNPTKPSRMEVLVDRIPKLIRLLVRWVVWRWVFKPGRDGKPGKWDKPPFQTNGRAAKSNDPKTWTNFDKVVEAARSGDFDGIGFVLGEGIVGIDLDDCRDPVTGEISEPAASIIKHLDTYTEISPSSTGVKLLVKAKLPAKCSKVDHDLGIEVYDGGRYFTITGHTLPGTPAEVHERQEQVDWLLEKWLARSDERKAESPQETASGNDGGQDDVELARQALAALRSKRAEDYDDWLKVGMALHSVDDQLLNDWDRWSHDSGKYVEGEPARKWRSFKRGGVGLGLGTLIHMAQQDGWTRPRAKSSQTHGTAEQGLRFTEDCPYEVSDRGTSWFKGSGEDVHCLRLANFSAKIVSDTLRDDGVEQQHTFEIEALHRGRTTCFSETAIRFNSMNWVTERLGASAIVEPGQGTRDRFRHAIQVLSGNPRQHVVYGHIGWRKVREQWCYLHGNGAIGPDGPVAGVEVALPGSLSNYVLPEPPEGEALRKAIRASLRVADVAPEFVTLPLLAMVWRPVLGPADFSGFLVGRTGAGKSELAALGQQHFGQAMANKHFPANWASTSNALEGIAFAAKDALLVVDDFAPSGSAADIARFHREADRLLRAQGNRSGRQRMRADASLRPDKYPRGLILSTGEDVPRGHSVRGRSLILEVGPDMDWARLTGCQRDAADGLYAAAMAGFLRWLAGRYVRIQDEARKRVPELRDRAHSNGAHRRTPGIVAELAYGWEVFLQFCKEAQILAVDEAESLSTRMWQALGRAAAAQAEQHAAADPVNRFLELLRAAIASGHAHLAGLDGQEPGEPAACGWRQRTVGTGQYERNEWQSQGDRVGWVDDDQLYLESEAAYQASQRMAGPNGDGLSVASKTLYKRMKERSLLVTSEEGRSTTRKEVQGSRKHVVHLRLATLLSGEPGQSSQSGTAGEIRDDSQAPWPDSTGRLSDAAVTIGPQNRAAAAGKNGAGGPVGPVGPIPEPQGTATCGEWGTV